MQYSIETSIRPAIDTPTSISDLVLSNLPYTIIYSVGIWPVANRQRDGIGGGEGGVLLA